jgi:predicted acylesterase/phospholipase RssA
VIGCDVGADRSFGTQRIGIFQVLVRAGMINSAATAAVQRELADVLFKPPLPGIDLLNWQAFDRAIDAGYEYARVALAGLPQLPRLHAAPRAPVRLSLFAAEVERRRVQGLS